LEIQRRRARTGGGRSQSSSESHVGTLSVKTVRKDLSGGRDFLARGQVPWPMRIPAHSLFCNRFLKGNAWGGLKWLDWVTKTASHSTRRRPQTDVAIVQLLRPPALVPRQAESAEVVDDARKVRVRVTVAAVGIGDDGVRQACLGVDPAHGVDVIAVRGSPVRGGPPGRGTIRDLDVGLEAFA